MNLYLTPDNWNRISHPMQKDEYGVWEITVPPTASGECGIPHDSKLKVRVYIHCIARSER